MQLLQPLLAISTLLLVTAASQKGAKLQRITNLAVSAAKSGPGPIALTDKTFEDITSTPRNYTAMVLLTALDSRFGCEMCIEIQPEFDLVARSWLKQHPDSDGLFFAQLDFAEGRATFQKLGLTSAPILYLYPATYGPTAKPGSDKSDPIRHEFVPTPNQAESFASSIGEHSTCHVTVQRPVDYTKPILFLTSFVLSILILVLTLPWLLPVLTHPTFWAILSLIAILIFISGYMFNQIRHTPYVGRNQQTGAPNYIAGGFSTQYAVESQIIGLVYAFLSFGTIALAMKVPRIKDPKRQDVALVVWSAMILVLFSFLMAIFKVKNGSYPLWLPPLMGRL